jgi:BirA family biotin operon repressor/biotin-[acetyl-CoA-carboxylase] ligase
MIERALLDPDRIRRQGARIGQKVLVFRETSSTNDVLQRMADGGEAEGTVVFAERQTAGRGQFGRTWDSQSGLGLWFSLLLRPQWPAREIENLTPLIAVVIAETLRACTGSQVDIKPPNDIYHEGRKLAGILTEARTGRSLTAIVGIGLNVNHAREDFPSFIKGTATSLRIACGQEIDREWIGSQILAGIESLYDSQKLPDAAIHERYRVLSDSWKRDTVNP